MSTQSYVTGYTQKPSKEEDDDSIYEVEIQETDAVEVDLDDEFDNFVIDLTKLDPKIKFIRFWRG